MGELWWLQISNARRLIENIIKTVQEGNSVLLYMPDAAPFQDVFNGLVNEKLRSSFADKTLEEFDLCLNPIAPVDEYMLQHYCKKSKRLQYRGTKSIADFLAESFDIVFHSRYFWVHNIPDTEVGQWTDFANDYNAHTKTGINPAFFILCCDHEEALRYAKGNVKAISFNSEISDYDKYAFCTVIASENSCKLSVRDYLCQLASSCAGEDVELCAKCLAHANQFLANPGATISRILEAETRSNGLNFTLNLTESELGQKIWTAQVRTLFPIIESARVKFINTYYGQLQSAISSSIVKSNYGSSIKTPYDVEVGTFIFMAGNGLIRISEPEYDKLDLLRTVRNNLAHMIVTDFNLVDRVLSLKI